MTDAWGSLSLPRESDTKEVQKVRWARGYPSRVGTEAGRQSLPFSPVAFVFSILANMRNDVHRRKANNTWEGLLFPRVAFIKAFLQACERGPFLRTVAEGKWAAGTLQFPFHQLESILFPGPGCSGQPGVGSGGWGTEFGPQVWSCGEGDPPPTLPQMRPHGSENSGTYFMVMVLKNQE